MSLIRIGFLEYGISQSACESRRPERTDEVIQFVESFRETSAEVSSQSAYASSRKKKDSQNESNKSGAIATAVSGVLGFSGHL